MEFDGFNSELKIAFEHQGEQHYSTKTHWIKSDNDLKQRIKYDRRKYYLAKKNGVHLFRIPQVPQRIAPDRLIPYIAKNALKRGITVPEGWESLEIDYRAVYHGHGDERIHDCRMMAANKNGKFLSTLWRGEEVKYTWECAEGHQWETKARSVRKGNWCAQCSGKAKNTIEEMQAIAKAKGGECLSRTYVSAHKKLKFKCEESHIFYSSGSSVKNLDRWCPECSKKRNLPIRT
jgi:hypothetical protein